MHSDLPLAENDPSDARVLSATLAEIADVLDLDPLTAGHSRSLRNLNKRLKAQRIHLAVLGQFKRGKSTFLNALLGLPILPTAVLPLTSIPTFISWGLQLSFRVQFSSSEAPIEIASNDPICLSEQLTRYLAEESNPANVLGVSSVEVRVPVPLLVGENVLIDTPGIGSTHQHNTDATLRTLPHYDAAIVVLSPDPPITDAEVTFLRQLDARIKKIIFVMNKIDTVEEADWRQIERFLRSVLADRLPRLSDASIFGISSRDALKAKQASDRPALERSGIMLVEKFLEHYLAIEKAETLHDVIHRKAKYVLLNASDEIVLRLRAFEMPLQALEETIGLFSDAIGNAQAHQLVLPDLIAGRRRLIVAHLEETIAELRAEAEGKLANLVIAGLDRSRQWGQEAASAHATAIEDYFEAAQRSLFADFSSEMDEALTFLQTGVENLLASVRHSAEENFGMVFHGSITTPPLEIRSEPYWVSGFGNMRLIPDATLFVRYFVPRSWRDAWLQARLLAETKELVLKNAENLRWSLLRAFDENFRRAGADLQHHVDDSLRSMKHLATSTFEQRNSQQASVDADVKRLKKLKCDLNDFGKVLGGNDLEADGWNNTGLDLT